MNIGITLTTVACEQNTQYNNVFNSVSPFGLSKSQNCPEFCQLNVNYFNSSGFSLNETFHVVNHTNLS